MIQFVQKVISLFGFSDIEKEDERDINTILRRDFARLRAADPETQLQWLKLQLTLSTQMRETRQTRTRLISRFAFGAAIVAAAIVGAYLYYYIPRELAPETFATRKGEQTKLVLRDSSEVTLNYTTELTVPKMENGKARLLALKGEAFFRVRRNATPFIVSTEFADVQVVGTEFNVRAREGMLEVAVIHGIVNVSALKHGKENTLTLTQGQRAICSREGMPQLIADVPSLEYPGWMNGKLFFDKATFAAVCREIEMRFDVTITIDDANVRNEIVTGMLDAKNPESSLTALSGLTGKRFQYDGQSFRIF